MSLQRPARGEQVLASACLVFLLTILSAAGAGHAVADERVIGVWQASTYHHDGRDDPMQGLIVFTDRHFSAVVRFRISGGVVPDLNATTGTYRTEGSAIIFVRDIAANIRSGDQKQPVRYSPGEGVDERAAYAVAGDVLTITFESGNKYIAKRVTATK